MQKKNEININNIKEPSFLRSLSYEQLDELSSKIRSEIIDSISKNGGHLSSNLGVVELTISLHRNFDFTKDKLLFDVGHQCYTHKILTGRDISNIRRKDGVAGFIKNKESPYDIFEAGHSSTSLSAGLAFAMDRDNKKEHYEVVTLIGDASIANGVAFEALNMIPESEHKMIIILNDNNMAISSATGGLSNLFRGLQTSKSYAAFKKGFKRILNITKPLYKLFALLKNWIKRHLIATNIFDSLGFIYLGVIDGHDFKALDKAFKKAKKTDKSIVIHVRTKKGKGYSFAENDKNGYWHGVSPFNKETGEPLDKHVNQVTFSKVYSDLVKEKLETDPKFYLICPGTLKGAELDELLNKYPTRVIDTGIAEEHTVILASQLSKLGYHVCISIYSTFMQRAFDQISHDVARINSNVTFLVERSGLVGLDGDTHQGIFDESFLFSTPNVNIAMATNANEARAIFNQSFNNKGSTFIRFPRVLTDIESINKNYKFKNFDYINKVNSKLLIVGVGPLVSELAKYLISIDASVIKVINLKPIDKVLVNEMMKYSKILIYTPYETSNGLASNLVKELVKNGFKNAIYIKAIPDKFIEHASVEEQLSECGLTVQQIYKFVKEII